MLKGLRSKINKIAGNSAANAKLGPEGLAYQRLKEKGFAPASIIDVGAYVGNWTRMVRGIFPGVPVLMVEPQASKAAALGQVMAELPGTRYLQTLLGSRNEAAVTFFEMETGSSIFPENSDVPRLAKTLEMARLDDLAGDLPEPVFLKVDVQGAELEVLRGGESTLQRCEVIQLEVAIANYNVGAPTISEVLRFMEDRSFVPCDISGLTRPNGVDLVQIDMLFTPLKSPLRRNFFKF